MRGSTSGKTPTGQKLARAILSRLSRYGGKRLIAAITLPVISGLLLIAQVMVLSDVLGRAIADGVPLVELWSSLGWLAMILLARISLSTWSERLSSAASEAIKARLRDELIGRLLERKGEWVRSRSSGSLAATLVEQVEALDGYFARFLPAMVQAMILPLALAVAVMPVDIVVGLLFLLTAPMIPLFMALVGWGAEAAGNAQAGALSRLSAYFGDRLRGLKTLKLFGRMEAEEQAMRRATEELRQRTQRVLRIAFLSSAVLEFFAALGVAGVALYVGLTYLDMLSLRAEPLTLNAGLLCLLIAPEVYQPLRLLAAHYHDRANAMAAVGEIDRMFGATEETAAEQQVQPEAQSTPHWHGTLPVVSAEALTLHAPGSGTALLLDASLALTPGSRTALVGSSGIGKSTLLKALAGMIQATGSIRLAGRSLAEIDDDELPGLVTLIGQKPYLFHGTIAANIRFARPSATEEEVIAAAQSACVSSFAVTLPDGLDTMIHDGGVGLSGGEAQRVALARMFLIDSPILLLDEPTAHLDPRTEQDVLNNILAFATGKTLLVATHSPAVARRMDQVVLFADAKLVANPSPASAQREHAA
ncbi:thiol reductant ABC exporter subunit CydD [Neorhizobium sp. NPDC001467]|uniref:thiol reductant ABC exporter subunit CydD n=1 Tax=Neorhizobium sp. NPDC001467 TaxID=3390595 RepID=UPI003CFE826A